MLAHHRLQKKGLASRPAQLVPIRFVYFGAFARRLEDLIQRIRTSNLPMWNSHQSAATIRAVFISKSLRILTSPLFRGLHPSLHAG